MMRSKSKINFVVIYKFRRMRASLLALKRKMRFTARISRASLVSRKLYEGGESDLFDEIRDF